MTRVSELSSEIKAAAEGEDVSKAGRSDPHLPSQLEAALRPHQHGCAFSARMRWRKKKYSFHEVFVPAKMMRKAKK